MKWHDFDRNGKIDGRDYFLMDLLLNSEEEERENKPILYKRLRQQNYRII